MWNDTGAVPGCGSAAVAAVADTPCWRWTRPPPTTIAAGGAAAPRGGRAPRLRPNRRVVARLDLGLCPLGAAGSGAGEGRRTRSASLVVVPLSTIPPDFW